MATMPVTTPALQSGAFELGALLDMHFQEAAVAAGFELHARQARPGRRRQRVAQGGAVVAAAAAVHLGLRQLRR